LRTITVSVPHGRLKLRKENMPIHICNCRKETKDMERHSVLFFAAKVFHTPTRKSWSSNDVSKATAFPNPLISTETLEILNQRSHRLVAPLGQENLSDLLNLGRCGFLAAARLVLLELGHVFVFVVFFPFLLTLLTAHASTKLGEVDATEVASCSSHH